MGLKDGGSFSRVCSGIHKTTSGFCWEYSSGAKEEGKKEKISDDSLEEWRQLRDTGYQVSSYGNIKNAHGRFLKQGQMHHDKRRKTISFGKMGKFQVSRLVAEVFLPNPNNLPQVDHIDKNPSNNHVYNLRWSSGEDNIRHSNCVKVEQWSKDPANTLIKIWDSIGDAGRELEISHTWISQCCKGRGKTTGGFIWKYHQKES